MIAIRHDDLNRAVREAVTSIEPGLVAAEFVAALRPRRLEHWSSLASFALARTLLPHPFAPISDRPLCRVCGAAERVDAFPSDEFAAIRNAGVVRIDSLRYTLFDLEAFAKDARSEPTDDDRTFFDVAISRIADLRGDADIFSAERALGIVLPSRIERKLFLGILGVCGTIESPAHPGFRSRFIGFADRSTPDDNPYEYPAAWWRREYGLSAEALHDLGLDVYLPARTMRRLAAPSR